MLLMKFVHLLLIYLISFNYPSFSENAAEMVFVDAIDANVRKVSKETSAKVVNILFYFLS